ncbi:unnamed protein product [Adineta ricciae]|uniref:chitinase n=1 Tax=Adineta ricciae TaxID=249248 RepID=A0A813UZ72_ADIRI|nr:unnamed protein product [Adineta ricciae]
MPNERLTNIILIIYIFSQNFIGGNAQNMTHANTTRLCRNNCKMPSLSFQQSVSIPSNCGSVSSFYGCRVTIDVNYTRRTYSISFSAYEEDTFEMTSVDYDYSVDEALYLMFYRRIFTNTLIFTCLTDDYCADKYVSVVVQQLIDSESILQELLPLYLVNSTDNRTITCKNGTVDEIECYGGFCESITDGTTIWAHHSCNYPSELSVLSTVELTSIMAFFNRYQPENLDSNHINNDRVTLLCNVDLCNSVETRNRGNLILDRYNLAAFGFIKNDTTIATTTIEMIPSTTTSPSTYSTASPEISNATTRSTTVLPATQSPTSQNTLTSSCTTPETSDNALQPWHIALIVIGSIVLVAIVTSALAVNSLSKLLQKPAEDKCHTLMYLFIVLDSSGSVGGIRHTNGPCTATGDALHHVRGICSKHCRSLGEGTSRVVLVLTDRYSNCGTRVAPQSDLLLSVSRASVFTIGVGGSVNNAELLQIANEKKYVMHVQSHHDLISTVNNITVYTCGIPAFVVTNVGVHTSVPNNIFRYYQVDTTELLARNRIRQGITASQLKAIMPRCKHPGYLSHINTAMNEGSINTCNRKAAFLAQIAHESSELLYMEELASGAAYEGRKDLGNTEKGDGKRYKGRGPIQLTGRANYRAAGKALNLDLINHPEKVKTPEVGFRTTVWFWTKHKLNELADKKTLQSFRLITRRINGGRMGEADREKYWTRAKKALGC